MEIAVGGSIWITAEKSTTYQMYRLLRRHSGDRSESVLEESFSRDEVERLLEEEVSYLQKNCQVTVKRFPYLEENDRGTLVKFNGFWIRYWIERI